VNLKVLNLPEVSEYLDEDDIEDRGLIATLAADPFYAPQLRRILEEGGGDIDGTFVGFTATYRHLAALIPLHFTVVDLGCAYAAQSYYFRRHRKYIGVDGWSETRISAPNTQHLTMPIVSYLKERAVHEGSGPVFAICNYVPTSTTELRAAYVNLFVYYPEGPSRAG
jgi:hypothetical protein